MNKKGDYAAVTYSFHIARLLQVAVGIKGSLSYI